MTTYTLRYFYDTGGTLRDVPGTYTEAEMINFLRGVQYAAAWMVVGSDGSESEGRAWLKGKIG